MDAGGLRAACLALTGAWEDHPFGRHPEVCTFKVAAAGKIFALATFEDEPLRVTLKCDPELAVQLRANHPAIVPGYHTNKRHWNTVFLDGTLPDTLVHELIEDSYDLVVASLTRAQRAGLTSGRGPEPPQVGE